MDFAQVKRTLADKSAVVVDVRGREERSKEFIPGSQHIPMDELGGALAMPDGEFQSKYGFTKPKKGDKIITHCQKGGRAGKAAQTLQDAGFCNTVAYGGSLNDWKANGGETTSA